MDIVLSGRHCEVPDRFRSHVTDKLGKLERSGHRVIRVDVEVTRELNPRRADEAHRIELTVHSKGPVIRAEAAADDRYAAFDLAVDKLFTRMRKAADRRRERRRTVRKPLSAVSSTDRVEPRPRGGAPAEKSEVSGASARAEANEAAADRGTRDEAANVTVREGPMVVREKTHTAEPINLDQALYEMELVGHDFYLFVDADTKMPSVVYRRKGYDYGVIRLDV